MFEGLTEGLSGIGAAAGEGLGAQGAQFTDAGVVASLGHEYSGRLFRLVSVGGGPG